MKLALLTILALSNVAQARANFEGTFSVPHSIMVAYPTAHGCRASGGTWDKESAKEDAPACEMPSEDTVVVSRVGKRVNVDVATSGRNAHECEFSGEGHFISATKLRVVQLGDLNDDGTRAPNCTVVVDYVSRNVVNVTSESENNCYCPSGTSIDLDHAKRISKAVSK